MQPKPKKSDHPDVIGLILADLTSRVIKGKKKYGTRLKPFNGRSALLDLYEELLDAVFYIRQELYERDHNAKS